MKSLVERFIRALKDKGVGRTLRETGNHLSLQAFKLISKPLKMIGLYLLPYNYYEPVIDREALGKRPGFWEKESGLPGIDMAEPGQLTFLRDVAPIYQEEYSFPRHPGKSPAEYYLNNGMFGAVDAEVAHVMVRHFAPKRIIEVGSGFSTLVMAGACLINREKSGINTELVSIEPYPNQTLRKGVPGLAELVQKKAETVPVEFFTALKSGDFLFIDTSHVVRTGGEVNHFYLEVLPRLQPGTIIHIHDIFFPREYPRRWVMDLRRSWNEQYLLQAFLIFNRAFRVLWSSSFMHCRHADELKAAFPGYDPSFSEAGSFWMQKTE